MTASPNARGAPAPVHDLSHSSVGTDASFIPVRELPPTFTSLGDAAAEVVAGRGARRLDPDADLFALIASHAPAKAAAAEAETKLAAAKARFDEVAPERPAATYYRFDDPLPHHATCKHRRPDGRIFMVYGEEDIEELRDGPEPQSYNNYEGRRLGWNPCRRGIERKAEILAAFDGWKAERADVAQRVGWTVANADATAARKAALNIANAIIDTQPLTLAGLAAKALWVQVEDKLDDLGFVIVWDVLSLLDPEGYARHWASVSELEAA